MLDLVMLDPAMLDAVMTVVSTPGRASVNELVLMN